MKISLTVKEPARVSCDLLVFLVTISFQEELASFDSQTKKLILEAAKIENFTGENKQNLYIDTPHNQSKKVLLYGIGNGRIEKVYDLQNTVAQAVKKAQTLRRKKIALKIHSSFLKTFSKETLSQILTEAIFLSTYTFDKYKGEKHHKEKIVIEEVIFLVSPSYLSSFEKGINLGELFADSTAFARDLVNEPAAVTTPLYLTKVAQTLAKKNGLEVKIFEREQIEKLGMGAFLGVSQGSSLPPKFIKLTYKPKGAAKAKIVLIGKGITFDTGGLSLKPGQSMEIMKIDMAGAATVLGVFSRLSELKPKVTVVGLIAACENMPSGSALHPGDILKALNGKTIEVVNTDAEGRLTLADALSFAVKYEKPEAIIDLATLTGSMITALGQEIAGLFSNNSKLKEKMMKSAAISGELVWEMPLFKDYKEQLKSEIADLRNVATQKAAGSITAALFLEEFVDSSPWVHLDIAGTAYAEKNTPLCLKGGTGFGVRLLLSLLSSA